MAELAIWQFLGYCVKHYFVSRNYCGSFLGIFWKFGLLFIPSSGHTGLSEGAIKGRQQERKKKSWNIFQVCDHQVKTGSDWMCPSTSHRPTTTKKCFSSFKKEKIPSKLFNFGPLSWPVWPVWAIFNRSWQRTLTIGGSITVQLTSCLTGLDFGLFWKCYFLSE